MDGESVNQSPRFSYGVGLLDQWSGGVKGSHEETSIRHGIRRRVVLRWSFCDQVSALGERVRNKLGHSTSTESAGYQLTQSERRMRVCESTTRHYATFSIPDETFRTGAESRPSPR
ncbi:hypothetical protein CBL_00561 [Carabus blaptoides fortunei]